MKTRHCRLPAFCGGALFLLGTVKPVAGQLVPSAPFTQHEYSEFVQYIYGELANELNRDIRLPAPVALTSGACGQANAFYVPEQSQVVLCTELMDAVAQRVRAREMSDAQRAMAFASQIVFITLHEIGHALIHVLDLPAVGQEEDAVDQLAALFFAEEPILAMWAADYWSQNTGRAGRRTLPMEAFADEHDLNEQRFFNIMCWTYGADPLVRGYVVELSGLPLERAQRCPGEYDRLRSAWERILADHLKNPRTFEELVPERNASGYWRFMESMSDTQNQVRCTASGTLTLWQMDVDLAGSMTQQGSCVYFAAPIDNSASAEIDSGKVSESGLEFAIANCGYKGSFLDDSRTSFSGTMVCTMDVQDGTLELSGSWHAVR